MPQMYIVPPYTSATLPGLIPGTRRCDMVYRDPQDVKGMWFFASGPRAGVLRGAFRMPLDVMSVMSGKARGGVSIAIFCYSTIICLQGHSRYTTHDI